MEQLDGQDRLLALRRAGVTEREIQRLCRFRRTYTASLFDWPTDDLARLRFIRWLVVNKRLTDDREN
jgi:hypothetical protein